MQSQLNAVLVLSSNATLDMCILACLKVCFLPTFKKEARAHAFEEMSDYVKVSLSLDKFFWLNFCRICASLLQNVILKITFLCKLESTLVFGFHSKNHCTVGRI